MDLKGLKNLKPVKKEISLTTEINRNLKKKANPNYGNWKPDRGFKPSMLGHPCHRKIFYSYLREDRDTPIQDFLKRIFDTGNIIHDMIGEWVDELGYLIKYKDPKTGEVPIHKKTKKPDPEFPIKINELSIPWGKIDAILNLNGELYIGEWKSTNVDVFKEIKDAGAPKAEHVMQANIYAHLFDICREKGHYDHIKELEGLGPIKGIKFIYLNKNSSFLQEFTIERSDKGLHEIMEKIEKGLGYVREKELPEANKSESNCKFCEYTLKCKRNYNPLSEKKET